MAGLDSTMNRTLARQGAKLGFMEPVIPALQEAKTFSALDLPCPDCGVADGSLCPGPILHRARVAAAVTAMRAGELAEADPEQVISTEGDEEAELRLCPGCSANRTKRGNKLACRPEHQCLTNLGRDRGRCPRQRVAGFPNCASHDGGGSWNNRLRRPGSTS